MRNSTKGELVLLGVEFGDVLAPILGVVLLIILVGVAFWYFQGTLGNVVARGTTDFAGGISNGLYNLKAPSVISDPVNSWLGGLVNWGDSFYDPSSNFAASNGGDGSAVVTLGS